MSFLWTVVILIVVGALLDTFFAIQDGGEGSTPTSRKAQRIFRNVAVVAIILSLVFSCRGKSPTTTNNTDTSNTGATSAQPQVVLVEVPTSVMYRTTPDTLTLDFEFNVEADAPINITYLSENRVVSLSGKGCQQLPQPRYSGPKAFNDPKNPNNGHIAFRIYRINGGACP